MDKKCHSCRNFLDSVLEMELCKAPVTQLSDAYYTPLDLARKICDREGDGHFVYFEPLDEAPSGAAFVQITREPRARTAAGGAR